MIKFKRELGYGFGTERIKRIRREVEIEEFLKDQKRKQISFKIEIELIDKFGKKRLIEETTFNPLSIRLNELLISEIRRIQITPISEVNDE